MQQCNDYAMHSFNETCTKLKHCQQQQLISVLISHLMKNHEIFFIDLTAVVIYESNESMCNFLKKLAAKLQLKWSLSFTL